MESISNELLLLIAEHVRHVNQRDYFRMLRVCRSWHAFLSPRAYNRISIGHDQIYPLVRCVYENPNIGAAIRDLDVWWASGSNDGCDVEMVNDAVRRVCDSPADRKEWKGELRQGNPDAWFAVLVQSLEAVTSLTLQYSYSDYFIPMLSRMANRDPPFNEKPVLQHLERVTVRVEDIKTAYESSSFLQLFRLPAMRMLEADAVYEAHESDSIYPKPDPGTSGIRELRIMGNGSKGMADYITSCANLEIFDYDHDNKAVWGEIYLIFHPGAFYAALVTQKHSLRELRLSDHGETEPENCDDYDDYDEGNEHFNLFGSLTEFHQLRELCIPVRTLLQFGLGDTPRVSLPDILPPNLEYLDLYQCLDKDFDVVMADLKRVVAQRTERFPNLTKLYIRLLNLEKIPRPINWWSFEIPVSTHQAFATLTEICNQSGIDFRLRKSAWLED
ncbi:hypothetical protein N7478_007038 [Penicillium angulare]|uniref:uncharacterized protein n=1 Tax=Penicillium angulare TaxID=116970 RepID=UPI0025410592|nr:uncharacterized protein N7478_007038 [Penicillium angulare]KAJ5281666.1 hypothetical protein N7478_007038 [Penicillium angulare]